MITEAGRYRTEVLASGGEVPAQGMNSMNLSLSIDFIGILRHADNMTASHYLAARLHVDLRRQASALSRPPAARESLIDVT